MGSASNLLHTADPHGHFVQLYNRDAGLLSKNVAAYLAAGFDNNESAIVIATREHCDSFVTELRRLGVDTDEAVAGASLLLLDAAETLGELMIDGHPDWERSQAVIRSAIGRAANPKRLRVYGEMVGLLWTAHRYTAAIQLEEFWNRLLGGGEFSLFCSYPIDIFSKDFQVSGVDALLCDHTRLLSTGTEENLEEAVNRAMDDILGAQATGIRLRMESDAHPSWGALPKAEAIILWLRENLSGQAEDIMSLARRYYDSGAPASRDRQVPPGFTAQLIPAAT